MHRFSATLQIIGINPYVLIPVDILTDLFKKAGKDKGPIRVKGTINGVPFTQSLVKFRGAWRLYINMVMLKDSPRRIGEVIQVSIAPGEEKEVLRLHPLLKDALQKNKIAGERFASLSFSRQQEMIRYIAALKTEESIARNVNRAVAFLEGKERFMGRSL